MSIDCSFINTAYFEYIYSLNLKWLHLQNCLVVTSLVPCEAVWCCTIELSPLPRLGGGCCPQPLIDDGFEDPG